ncbi:hypothetical protein SAMN05421770_104102 [Granulicella rosea]|uniref:Uncharacterized protein n=1 Tax=Granulicella rosea TaxID=474952 RepID=A0A239JSK2_9BACT|nr:hypothetical protein SAMN05421770_104102 [Granulicella rosea]
MGTGAREAAKALLSAADAAAAPDPKPSANAVRERVAQVQQNARQTTRGVREGSRRFGEAAWGPVAKAGGTIWLEVTGVFFALVALAMGTEAWRLRANLHDLGPNHALHLRFLVAAGVASLFGFFSLSNFVRANLRSRR